MVYCPSPEFVAYEDGGEDEQLHDSIGDFSVGVLFADSWAKALQHRLGLRTDGDQASLQRDCLTGAWVADVVPRPTRPTTFFAISPGDLDEAVQTYLVFTQDANESADQAPGPHRLVPRGDLLGPAELRPLICVDAGRTNTLAAMPEPVETLAAIDVGTNSFHLVVARVTGDDRFEVVTSEKEMVRLGTGGGDMKRLTPEAIQRGVDTLRRMKQIADIDGAPGAGGGHERGAGGREPRRVRRRGRGRRPASRSRSSPGSRRPGSSTSACCRPCRSSTSACCCATSAAASTELLVGQQGEVLAARSFKLGAVRLDQPLLPRRAPAPERGVVVPHVRALDARRRSAGGRRRTASRWRSARRARSRRWRAMARARPASRRRATCNAATASRRTSDAAAVAKALADGPIIDAAGQASPALDAERADIILAGALILEGVLRGLRRSTS